MSESHATVASMGELPHGASRPEALQISGTGRAGNVGRRFSRSRTFGVLNAVGRSGSDMAMWVKMWAGASGEYNSLVFNMLHY